MWILLSGKIKPNYQKKDKILKLSKILSLNKFLKKFNPNYKKIKIKKGRGGHQAELLDPTEASQLPVVQPDLGLNMASRGHI